MYFVKMVGSNQHKWLATTEQRVERAISSAQQFKGDKHDIRRLNAVPLVNFGFLTSLTFPQSVDFFCRSFSQALYLPRHLLNH